LLGGGLVLAPRLLGAPALGEQLGEGIARARLAWRGLDGSPIGRERGRRITQAPVDVSHQQPRIEDRRVQPRGRGRVFQRALVLVAQVPDAREVEVRARKARIDRQGVVEGAHRLVEAVERLQRGAHLVPGARVVGIGGYRGAEALEGLGHPSLVHAHRGPARRGPVPSRAGRT
jgi:hypothetical protein